MGAPLLISGLVTGWEFGSKTKGGSREGSGGAAKLARGVAMTMRAFGAPAVSLSSIALYCAANVAGGVSLVGSPALTAPRKSLPPIQMAMKVGCSARA